MLTATLVSNEDTLQAATGSMNPAFNFDTRLITASGSEMRVFFRAFATETTETDTETANTVSKK